MDYCRIWHAATLNSHSNTTRGRYREAKRTHTRNPTTGWALFARSNKPEALGERQVRIDCDVIQADGGTRTAAITGSWVALNIALGGLLDIGALRTNPLIDSVAAVSCGISNGTSVLDLDYEEDSRADADANFVLSGDGMIVEVQGTAETHPFSRPQFTELLDLAFKGCEHLKLLQQASIKKA